MTFKCKGCGKKYKTKRENPIYCLACEKGLKKHPDLVAISESSAKNFPARCFCRKEAKFSSALLNQVFCSERCYDEAKERHDKAETLPQEENPHIHFSANGEAYFICAEIGFRVDNKDLNKVIGSNGERCPFNGLMDSQLMAIAHAVGWRTDPFVRELLLLPLIGLLQNVWYRDVENRTSENLENNQKKRLDKYYRDLLDYKAPEPGAEPRKVSGRTRAPKVSAKSQMMSKYFAVTQDAKNVASGREFDLLTAARALNKKFTFPELVTAAEGKVKTKQNFEMIVLRFLKELIAHNAVKEVV